VFLAIAIGLGFVDDRIKSAWDVESFIGVQLLGIIPQLGPRSATTRRSSSRTRAAGDETGQ
jgi:succinoglycan biosynthesis transport protein ExoP